MLKIKLELQKIGIYPTHARLVYHLKIDVINHIYITKKKNHIIVLISKGKYLTKAPFIIKTQQSGNKKFYHSDKELYKKSLQSI